MYETRNRSQEENWKIYKNMEAKWHIIKQWTQTINQKAPGNKLKWTHNNPKPMGHSEGSFEREVHSNIGLKKQEKSQIKDLSLQPRKPEKEQQSPEWVEGRK